MFRISSERGCRMHSHPKPAVDAHVRFGVIGNKSRCLVLQQESGIRKGRIGEGCERDGDGVK